MRILKRRTTIDFVGLSKVTGIASAALVLAALLCIALRGFNFGIDFTGGLLAEVGYPHTVELEPVRDAVAKAEFKDAQVQYFGSSSDVLVRLSLHEGESSKEVGPRLMQVLQAQTPGAELRRLEFVGPQVGEELAEAGMMATLFTLIGIMIYVAFRFQWKFALGSVLALAHNVILTLGLFSVTHIEFDLTALAAILAVIGYSINDTIVVFDRIRENFLKVRRGTVNEIVNLSHNQTLARTLMTGVTVFMVLFSLMFLGGETLFAFTLALITGIAIGTYASIFVASSIALALGVKREDLLPPKPEELEEKLQQQAARGRSAPAQRKN